MDTANCTLNIGHYTLYYKTALPKTSKHTTKCSSTYNVWRVEFRNEKCDEKRARTPHTIRLDFSWKSNWILSFRSLKWVWHHVHLENKFGSPHYFMHIFVRRLIFYLPFYLFTYNKCRIYASLCGQMSFSFDSEIIRWNIQENWMKILHSAYCILSSQSQW